MAASLELIQPILNADAPTRVAWSDSGLELGANANGWLCFQKRSPARRGASDRASASWATLGAGWIGPPQPGHL